MPPYPPADEQADEVAEMLAEDDFIDFEAGPESIEEYIDPEKPVSVNYKHILDQFADDYAEAVDRTDAQEG